MVFQLHHVHHSYTVGDPEYGQKMEEGRTDMLA